MKLSWKPLSTKYVISQYLHKLLPVLQQNFLNWILCISQYSLKRAPSLDLESWDIKLPTAIWALSLFSRVFNLLNILSISRVYSIFYFLSLCWLILMDLLTIISLKIPVCLRVVFNFLALITTRSWIVFIQKIKFMNIFIFAPACWLILNCTWSK